MFRGEPSGDRIKKVGHLKAAVKPYPVYHSGCCSRTTSPSLVRAWHWSREKRAEYKQRFLDLVGLSDQEMGKKLPGRQKYCPRCLQPLPFEGISVIHNISHEDANELGLAGMADSVVSDMSSAGLERKVALVSTDSFHATTFDLINHGEHEQKLADAGFAYEQVRADVEKAAGAFMRECTPLAETITIAGLGMFWPVSLKLDLSISQDVLNRFQTFRN